MPVTRIKNNQITDLTVNAAAKLQDYSLTSGKIANNLTYGSDLTITGNLTVNGNTTTIDTVNLVVEDPLILLAKEQTGSPSLDIGFIGKRGTSENIAFVWDESAAQFAAIFTNSETTNTTVNINSYASLRALDIVAASANISGNVTIGNISGDLNVTGNISGANLTTAGLVSATGNVTGGNVNTAGVVTATGNVTGGNLNTAGIVTATGNITGGNVNTAGNVQGGNLLTGGLVSATGNVTGGNVTTAGLMSATGNINGGNLISAALVQGVTVSASGNVIGGNVTTAGLVSATGNVTGGNLVTAGVVTATGNVAGGNVTTAGLVSATGNVTGGNVNTAGVVTATGNITGGNVNTAGNVQGGNLLTGGLVSATGNVTGGNVTTAGLMSATGNITGGNVNTTGNVQGGNLLTGGLVSATGNVTGGNLNTAGLITATGNITGGNLLTAGLISATGNITGGNLISGNAVVGNINVSGNIVVNSVTSNTVVSATGNVIGGNVNTAGLVSATGNVTGGNVTTAGVVTATGNVTGGNVNTAGAVSATGNVTGGNITTAGSVSATGNINGGNVVTSSVSTASGDLILNSAGGNLQWDGTGNIVMNAQWINNLSDPVRAQDAATKEYVDNAVSTGITIHEPVRVESPTALTATYAQGGTTATVTQTIAGNTVVFSSAINPQVNDQLWFTNSFQGIQGNVPYFVVSAPNTSAAVLSTTYNGVPVANITSATGLTQAVRINSGQGATLTNAGANATLTIDGVTLSNTNRVLIYQQANAVHNGVYVVSNAGNATSAWVLTRSDDMNTYRPDDVNGLDAGDYFYVQEGDSGAGESYVMTAPIGPTIIGYANLTFTQFSASQVYTANTAAGIVLNGTVFSAKVDNDTTAFDGGGNIIVKAGANLVTPNIGAATGSSLSVTGNVTGGNLNSGGIVSATGNVTGGNVTTAGLVTATGNVTGGNLVTAGVITATGNITGGNVNTAGALSATGNVQGGNITTAGLMSATGNINGGNLISAALVQGVTVSASGNVIGGNVTTAGLITATGNITGGNVTTAGLMSATGNINGGNLISAALLQGTTVSATGNVIGGNVTTAGLINATGNITGGNVNTAGALSATGNVQGGNLVTAGLISATGNITGGNLGVGSGNITGGNVSVTGNVTAVNFIGNISGNIDAAGANTEVQFNDNNLLGASSAFTFNTASNLLTVGGTVQGTTVSATGNVVGGNVNTAGVVTATGNVTGGNLITAGVITATGNVTGGNVNTAGLVSATGNVTGGNVNTAGVVTATGNVTGGNINTAGVITATGTVTGGNLVTAGNGNIGNIRISGNDITGTNGVVTFNEASADVDFRFEGNGDANLLVLDAGTDTVNIGTATPVTGAKLQIASADSMLIPVGNTQQRPAGTTGMLRFNTSINNIEYYDADSWTPAGADFTIIVSDQFTGNGVQTQFTLSQDSTTASTIVAINGVVQIPVTSYAVSGNVLTFTEAPESTDVIDARILTTTTTVSSLQNGNGSAIFEASDSLVQFEITGNLVPTANATANIGSSSLYFNRVFAVSTSAVFSDLAEMYEADSDIAPGTVVCFGGSKEITVCDEDSSRRVAGVISTNPSYLMNSAQTGEYVVALALTGRVPVKVLGTVRKGDMMVSAGQGCARAEPDPTVGSVIGKALEDFDPANPGDQGTIEVVVGRL